MIMMLNEIAQPILYHASFDRIRKFWPLSHFGTYRAALSRIIDVLDDTVDDATDLPTDPVLLYPVRLSCENPLRTRDIYNERPYIVGEVSSYVLKKYADSLSLTTHEQLQTLVQKKTTPASTRKLSEVLSHMGYDCLAYRNKVEDPGSISWINLTSEQVHVLSDPIKVSPEKLHQLRKSYLGTWKEPQTEQMHPHQMTSSFDIPVSNSNNGGVVAIRHDTLGI
jgi:hypothetical protein